MKTEKEENDMEAITMTGIMQPRVTVALTLVAVCYASTLAFIFTDLWSGVRKARRLGQVRTSEGLKRTIDKIARYGNMMLALTFTDAVQTATIYALDTCYGFDIVMMPWFTVLGALYAAFVETKSIRENATAKEQENLQYALDLIAKAAGQKGRADVVRLVMESVLKEGKEEKDDEGKR